MSLYFKRLPCRSSVLSHCFNTLALARFHFTSKLIWSITAVINGKYLLLHQSWHRESIDLQDSVPNMDGVPNLWTNMHPSDPVRIRFWEIFIKRQVRNDGINLIAFCYGFEYKEHKNKLSVCALNPTRAVVSPQLCNTFHVALTVSLAWGVVALWWICEVINNFKFLLFKIFLSIFIVIWLLA